MFPTITFPVWFQVKVGCEVNVHTTGKAAMKQQLSCWGGQRRMPGICVAQPGFIDLLGCLGSERQQPGLHLPLIPWYSLSSLSESWTGTYTFLWQTPQAFSMKSPVPIRSETVWDKRGFLSIFVDSTLSLFPSHHVKLLFLTSRTADVAQLQAPKWCTGNDLPYFVLQALKTL